MSTRTHTPNQQTPYQQTPGGGPSRFRIWAVAIGAAAVVAIVALVMILTPPPTAGPDTPGIPGSPYHRGGPI